MKAKWPFNDYGVNGYG